MELSLRSLACFRKGNNLGRLDQPLRVSAFAKQILNYWLENPQASDTVEGIAVWWLQYKEFERGKPRVERALLELVNKHLVIKKHNSTSEDTYELNPAMKSQVRRIVKGRKTVARRNKRTT